MRNIMAHTGDRVRIKGTQDVGQILKIRFDDNNEEIYTVAVEGPNTWFDSTCYTRHCELEWL